MSTETTSGVKVLAKLSGVSETDLWNGAGNFPGLKTVLATPEKRAIFDQVVEETVRNLTGKCRDSEVASHAMNAAGQAILGNNRPPPPGSAEAVIETGVKAGILRRV